MTLYPFLIYSCFLSNGLQKYKYFLYPNKIEDIFLKLNTQLLT